MHRLFRTAAVAGVTVTLVMANLAAAHSDESRPISDPLSMLPVVELAGPDKTPDFGRLGGDDPVLPATSLPTEVLSAVKLATVDYKKQVNNVIWDAPSKTLIVYVTEGFAEDLKKSLSASAPEAKVSVRTSAHSQSEIEETVYRYIDSTGKFPDGTQVALWYPSEDGSTVTFELAGSETATKQSNLPSTLNGLPVHYLFGTELTLAARDYDGSYVLSGIMMRGQGKMCTSGFPVKQTLLNIYGNLTADHCGSGSGGQWLQGSSSSTVVGYSSGQVPYSGADGTDLEVFENGNTPLGVIAWGNSMLPWDHYSIFGYFNAVVGQDVCYGGAMTGTYCTNYVTDTGVRACYGGGLPCYQVVRTEQSAGEPAAGNGDSGGPVGVLATRIDGQYGFYGTGIISGISNPTSSCHGEPASSTRKCSSTVLFAPLSRFYEVQNVTTLLISG